MCQCGHKRGLHEKPLAENTKVGKCNFEQCGCTSYNSLQKIQSWDKRPVFLREFIYQLVITTLVLVLGAVLLTSTIPELTLLPFTWIVFVVTVFYFKFLKPFDVIDKQEKLEK